MEQLTSFNPLEILADVCENINIFESSVSPPYSEVEEEEEEKEKEHDSSCGSCSSRRSISLKMMMISKTKNKRKPFFKSTALKKKTTIIRLCPDHHYPHGWLKAHLQMVEPFTFRTPHFIVHFHKILTVSDVKNNLNRLLIPKKIALKTLIPRLMGGDMNVEEAIMGPLTKGIGVVGLDPIGRKWDLDWKWWSSNDAHILTGNWMKLVKCNGLIAEAHQVDVSVFRCGEGDSKICFLILHSDAKKELEETK